MFKSFLIAGLLLTSSLSFAQEIDPALVISSVEVHQVENPDDKATVELPKVPTNPIDEVAMYLDGLIAIGKRSGRLLKLENL